MTISVVHLPPGAKPPTPTTIVRADYWFTPDIPSCKSRKTFRAALAAGELERQLFWSWADGKSKVTLQALRGMYTGKRIAFRCGCKGTDWWDWLDVPA